MIPNAKNYSLAIQASLFLWVLIGLSIYGLCVLFT